MSIILYFEGITSIQIVLMSLVAALFIIALVFSHFDVKFQSDPTGRKCWIDSDTPGVVRRKLDEGAYLVFDLEGNGYTLMKHQITPRYGVF